MLKNIDVILKKLGYVPSKINKNQIRLRKNNVDALETAMIINNESISQMILDYIDFRIEHDINAKKDILNNLGQYIEPLRKKIKEANSSLEDNIFYFLNNLNIRHNNISGKAKIDYVANMSEEQMINWYDKIYNLILIAIRLIEMPKTFKELKKLKEQIINDEFKTKSRKE